MKRKKFRRSQSKNKLQTLCCWKKKKKMACLCCLHPGSLLFSRAREFSAISLESVTNRPLKRNLQLRILTLFSSLSLCVCVCVCCGPLREVALSPNRCKRKVCIESTHTAPVPNTQKKKKHKRLRRRAGYPLFFFFFLPFCLLVRFIFCLFFPPFKCTSFRLHAALLHFGTGCFFFFFLPALVFHCNR